MGQSLKGKDIYRAVWRWHFYAGLIFSPFILILAISGGVYLFKPQIESVMYQDLYYVQEEQASTLPPTTLMQNVQEEYPDAIPLSIRFNEESNRTAEIGFLSNGEMATAYVDPYAGVVQGSLINSEKFTEIFKKIHSELFIGGTFANRLVELAACWTVVLLVTGLYLWWPRNKKSIWGTVLPRLRSKGRIFWRDMHAVPAFWLSALILLVIASGLPWSGVMGDQINRVATSTNTGFPPYALSFLHKPESVVKAADVAEDVPWAVENVPVPQSRASAGYISLPLEDIVHVAEMEQIQKPYTISMPQGETGVYTVATSHSRPGDNATIHLDQYSATILSDVRFHDYGVMAQAITLGIAFHEGRLFGLANQLIGLIAALGLILIIVSAFFMWKKRKPSGKAGAPSKPKDKRVTITVFAIMIVLGIMMPLVGISIVIMFVIDRFILSRIPRFHAWYS